jgi:hypothetical protein
MYLILSSLVSFLLVAYFCQSNLSIVYGEDIEISSGTTFVDSNGKINVIGVVTNIGISSEHVTVGLDVRDKIGGSKNTLRDTTFSKIIFPGKESPFKFKIGDGYEVLGKPYLLEMKNGDEPNYNVIVQNYSNFPMGQNKELVGTLKNVGNVVVKNINVFASVHDKEGRQIDSIKSNIISTLNPGETKHFSAAPDQAIARNANYFSCAGFNPNSPINTLELGNGRFLPYSLESIAKISDFEYTELTDSISFVADHYNPLGGIVTLKIPQLDNNHNITVFLDNLDVHNEHITKDGKTITINIFIPPSEHNVRVSGILNH